tara:strand:+ start:9305 stop:11638 length:2334 start_codon:yes stop_codon:yes gene_type:complete
MSIADDNNKYIEQRDILASLNEALGKKVNKVKDARDAMSSLISATTKLAQQEEGLGRLTDKQLGKLYEKSSFAKVELEDAAKILAKKTMGSKFDGKINDQTLNRLKYLGKINEQEEELLRGAANGFEIQQDSIDLINKELVERKKSNDLMGVGGNMLKGLNTVAGKFASAFKLDEVQAEMEALADSIAKGVSNGNKLTVLGKGISTAFKGLSKSIADPAVIFTALLSGFLKVEAAQKEFRSQTGQNIQQFGLFNGSLLTTAEYMKAAVELSKELGVNAAVVFSEDTIIEVGELTEHMGLGAKEAANLAKFAKLSGKELSTVTGNTFKATSEFIKTNKVGISVKDVFNDIGNVSDSISLSLGGQPGKIRDAALAARELGLSLAQVDNIAGSLLQFESSISAELEAELITGKSINLEKAREYALMNNIEGVAKELMKNQTVMQAFASGNRVEQEAVAKAMGMNREEMSKMIFNQKMMGGLSAEQARKAADIGEEEAKRLTVQKQISNAVDKITQAFGGLLTYITPILNNTVVLYGVMVSLAALITGRIIMGFIAMGTQIVLNTTATAALTGANAGLASSQTVLAASSSTMGTGLIAAGRALGQFGISAASAIPIILSIGAAAVGIGFGLKLATPAIVAIGGVIGTIFKGIATVVTSVTQGFATMFSTISMDNILPIMLLGPALAGIGAGLALIAVSGTLALPALLALTALGTVAIGLNSVFGDNESTSPSSNNEMAEVNANLKKLISAVEQGGVVMLDSNKIGEYLPKILQLNEFKIGG